MLRLEDFRVAIDRRELDLLSREQFAVTDEPLHLVGLEQAGDTARELPHNTGPTLLHLPDVHAEFAGADAVSLEFVFGSMIELG